MSDGANVNQSLVRLLEQALEGAKAGSFRGGALVLATGDKGFVHFANAGRFDFYTPLIAGTSILLMDLQHTMRAAQQQNAEAILKTRQMLRQ